MNNLRPSTPSGKALLFIAIPILLSACTQSPQRPVAVPDIPGTPVATTISSAATVETTTPPVMVHTPVLETAPTPSENSRLLSFIAELQTLSAEAQRQKISDLNQQLANQQAADTDQQAAQTTKLQLAIIYSLPSSKMRDSSKAQILLDEILGDRQLGSEEHALASVLRNFLNDAGKSAQKIKEEQKRADTAQDKLDELQKKLNALKNIEKTMVDRDQGGKK